MLDADGTSPPPTLGPCGRARRHKQAVCAAARRALLEPAYCSWLEALPAVDDAGAAVQPAYRSAPAWRNRRTGADKLRAGPRAAARLV